jgi:hypothetical protein
MPNKSTRLLNSQGIGPFVGSKQKGSGYHLQDDNLHTFVLVFKDWQGYLEIQGTLALYPDDSRDWFPLKNQAGEKIIFNQDSTDYDDIYTVNSEGKFVWLRAVGTVDSGEISEIRYIY